ncbi:hypothetical protein sync_0324 [Synechococcus sp. CC9311]|nr:hypothetical protein sync_0324 [Synechococcus sp. CC9311]
MLNGQASAGNWWHSVPSARHSDGKGARAAAPRERATAPLCDCHWPGFAGLGIALALASASRAWLAGGRAVGLGVLGSGSAIAGSASMALEPAIRLKIEFRIEFSWLKLPSILWGNSQSHRRSALGPMACVVGWTPCSLRPWLFRLGTGVDACFKPRGLC